MEAITFCIVCTKTQTYIMWPTMALPNGGSCQKLSCQVLLLIQVEQNEGEMMYAGICQFTLLANVWQCECEQYEKYDSTRNLYYYGSVAVGARKFLAINNFCFSSQ